ncbi:SOS response-associated peptidase [Corynebacterium sp. TAE3-ERU12]|uniref:SOS response-associated peptidase n=1 Tax=Corynebacterium sp. TAE3-ERU12 TaxID=2849491 RepID=UPI001C44923F|nr:SOS response-associated peptidase [Corynebacterium sp. TAE3-ERU12]MBV7294830.1 SOS response-associated peptidase [Corynebacterium sp. TAE3-ERU12]
MCGRFVSFTVGADLAECARVVPGIADIEVRAQAPARFNVAPTEPAQVLLPWAGQSPVAVAESLSATKDAARSTALIGARWGLVPSWAKQLPTSTLFNARGETVAEKPSFRSAYRRQRCLVPVDGWYEWRDKQPYFVSPKDGVVFLAGLWEPWWQGYSCTIITTDAVGELAWLHHRMPRVLPPEECATWLYGTTADVDELRRPVSAAAVADFSIRAVSRAVGNASAQGPELLEGPAE